jgi:hypothetical protein
MPSSARHTFSAVSLSLVLGLISCQQTPTSAPATETTVAPRAPVSVSQIAGTPAGTVMTPDYIATVGRFAYIWGWPLVDHLNRSLAAKSQPGPGRMGDVAPVSPPGHISMLTDYIKADQHMIACPNQDTVYGSGYQHVDTQPVVIQVPDFGKRFYIYQITDARTSSFGSIGKQYGTKPGFYAIVGPNWRGTLPHGLTAVL